MQGSIMDRQLLISAIIDHTESRMLFFDQTFLPIVAGIRDKLARNILSDDALATLFAIWLRLSLAPSFAYGSRIAPSRRMVSPFT